MNLEIAEAALKVSEAEKALKVLKSERFEAELKAKEGVRAQYAERMLVLAKAVQDAEAALLNVKNSSPDHEWEGRKVYKMVPRGTRYMPLDPERVEGIIETVRIGARFANNLAHYSRPGIGAVIVRHLKKDGKPGLKFSMTFDGSLRGWLLAEDADQ